MRDSTFYWLPNCSTCKRAKKYLEEQGFSDFAARDLKSNPLSRAEVEELAGSVGGADALFSRRAVKYRELKLNERELSEAEMLDLMAREYTFLKRPILIHRKRAIAGFSEKNWKRFLEDYK